MLVFLDTEFTNLLCPQLLSVGMVTLDGREFYAEIDLNTDCGKHRVKASSDFVRNGDVLAQWGAGAKRDRNRMGNRTSGR